jgi:O-succinylbenzoic acid--CoA ligase
VSELRALDLPLGPELLTEIRRAYDDNAAVTILDARWSSARRDEMLALLRPHVIHGPGGLQQSYENPLECEAGDGAVVLTSGSSGTPKAAVLTWRALEASAQLTSAALRRGPTSVWAAVLPPSHIGGLAVLLRSLFTDSEILWADDLIDASRRGATHCAVVATQLSRYDLSHFDVVLLGGGPVPATTSENVVTTYGMTETGSGVVYDGLALKGVDLAVIDGEVFIHSPTLLRSYRDGTTPLVLGPDGRQGWLPSGDEAFLDHSGVLHVLGRRGNVINSGGEKVWPEDLERLFASVAGIDDLCIVGEPDPYWGQRPVALVVSQRESTHILDEFRMLATQSIGPWARPHRIVIVERIPRTPSGKIQRHEVVGLL